MSADDGIFIYKNKAGRYEVRYYFASCDYDEIGDMSLIDSYDTIEEAIAEGQKQQTEYGLSFDTESLT